MAEKKERWEDHNDDDPSLAERGARTRAEAGWLATAATTTRYAQSSQPKPPASACSPLSNISWVQGQVFILFYFFCSVPAHGLSRRRSTNKTKVNKAKRTKLPRRGICLVRLRPIHQENRGLKIIATTHLHHQWCCSSRSTE